MQTYLDGVSFPSRPLASDLNPAQRFKRNSQNFAREPKTVRFTRSKCGTDFLRFKEEWLLNVL